MGGRKKGKIMGFNDLLKQAGDALHHAKDVAVEKAEELKAAAEAQAGNIHLDQIKDQVAAAASHAKDAVSDAMAHPDQLVAKAKDAASHAGDVIASKAHDLKSAAESAISNATTGDQQ